MDLTFQYRSLVENLQLLAAPFERQIQLVGDPTRTKEKVVTSFGDAFLLMPALIWEGYLDQDSVASIIRCFNWMNMTDRNGRISSIKCFQDHECWQKVRQLAELALEDMGEKPPRSEYLSA